MNRAVVTWLIQQLEEKARVDPEKATPRALHKLYQATVAGIRRDLEVQARKIYDNMMEAEQKNDGVACGPTLLDIEKQVRMFVAES